MFQEAHDERIDKQDFQLTNSEGTISASSPSSERSVKQSREEINLVSLESESQASNYPVSAKNSNKKIPIAEFIKKLTIVSSDNMCVSINIANMSAKDSIAKKLAQLFETAYNSENDGKHQCNLCSPGSQPITQKKGTAYTNLMNHLDAKHENFKSIYQQYLGNTTSPKISFNYDTSVRNIFNWVNLVVKCQISINACENPDFILHTGLSKLDASKVNKYLDSLANIMNNGIHFVGLFSIYQTVHESRNLVLLAFLPFEDRTTQNADAHIKFFKDVLELYDKGIKNVLFLLGDNCSTNKKIANDLNLPLVECALHRLNLVVNDFINSSITLVNQIRTIVHMMRTYKNREKLAKVTNLKPVLDNATRWMSVTKMIKRCKELIPYITQSNRFSCHDILLVEQLDLNEMIIDQLNYFLEATNDLQNEFMNLDDVRTYFDLLIEEHPDLEYQLGKNAPVIQDLSFKEAVVKVLRRQESVLTSSEKQKLQLFIVE
ncbi:44384_t:CDS:2 [Gigaspora margarita]|uniref:44384_t:CDS:1 n=1 Tax=Gigaspora margarita TaxID=4874 RepID=A0ABN7V3G4_GIGMA|nr:44384_t:CDS:2 [Gigaspora margarita]